MHFDVYVGWGFSFEGSVPPLPSAWSPRSYYSPFGLDEHVLTMVGFLFFFLFFFFPFSDLKSTRSGLKPIRISFHFYYLVEESAFGISCNFCRVTVAVKLCFFSFTVSFHTYLFLLTFSLELLARGMQGNWGNLEGSMKLPIHITWKRWWCLYMTSLMIL